MSSHQGAQEASLYQTIEHRRKANDTPPYTRLFFACLLKEGSTVDGEKDLRNWIEEKKNQLSMKMVEIQRENPDQLGADIDLTGFTLINGPVLITLLESLPSTIEDALLYLRDEADKEESIYEKVKILAVNEENPDRLFPNWDTGKLSEVGLSVNEVDKTEDEQTKRVCEVYRTFLDAAFEVIHYSNSDKGCNILLFSDLQNEITELSAKQKSDLITRIAPSQESTSILIYSNFPTVQEYCTIFFEEEELALEDELTFPQPAYLSEFLQYQTERFDTYNGFKG